MNIYRALALSRAIHAKQVSCIAVMGAYLDHIDALNPKLNAFAQAPLAKSGDLLKGKFEGIAQSRRIGSASRDVMVSQTVS